MTPRARGTAEETVGGLRRLALQLGGACSLAAHGLEDEVDRVYLGSTNDADTLRQAGVAYDAWRMMGTLPPDPCERHLRAALAGTPAPAPVTLADRLRCAGFADLASLLAPVADRLDALEVENALLRRRLRERARRRVAA